jgi:hypothetical protein
MIRVDPSSIEGKLIVNAYKNFNIWYGKYNNKNSICFS